MRSTIQSCAPLALVAITQVCGTRAEHASGTTATSKRKVLVSSNLSGIRNEYVEGVTRVAAGRL